MKKNIVKERRMSNEREEAFDRLSEIKDEIKELMSEAKKIIRQHCEPITWERAKSYWFAAMSMALDNEHDYLGKEPFTMQDAIDELDDYVDEEEENNEETKQE